MQTLERFLVEADVVMRCNPVTINGDTPLITEPWAAQQYSCELDCRRGGRTVQAIIGSDNGAPALHDVLDTVAAEAAVVEQSRSYEQWATRMGFDPDSRRGERIYRMSRRQAKLLRQLLGKERYSQLLWQTERL